MVKHRHMNIGMRMKVMPGARILTMVTKKLRPLSDEMPRMSRPMFHRSMFMPGENALGQVGVTEPSAVGQRQVEPSEVHEQPPNRKTQKLSALIRGKATSRAPIWSGMRKLRRTQLTAA